MVDYEKFTCGEALLNAAIDALEFKAITDSGAYRVPTRKMAIKLCGPLRFRKHPRKQSVFLEMVPRVAEMLTRFERRIAALIPGRVLAPRNHMECLLIGVTGFYRNRVKLTRDHVLDNDANYLLLPMVECRAVVTFAAETKILWALRTTAVQKEWDVFDSLVKAVYVPVPKHARLPDMQDDTCVICMADTVDHVCLPCGHVAMCASCASSVMRTPARACPICQTQLSDVAHWSNVNQSQKLYAAV